MSRIRIVNRTFRSDSKNSKDWKQDKQTETIKNQCIRNKWKIDIRKWGNGLWPSSLAKGTGKYHGRRIRVDLWSKKTGKSLSKGRKVSIFSRRWWHWWRNIYQMEVQLIDKTPVQQNYNSVPRTLHVELKNYLEKKLD